MTIIDTTIFADDQEHRLVVRLRAYPVLAVVGRQTGITAFRIGPQLYVSQRDFTLSQTALDNLRPRALGAELATEYALHNER